MQTSQKRESSQHISKQRAVTPIRVHTYSLTLELPTFSIIQPFDWQPNCLQQQKMHGCPRIGRKHLSNFQLYVSSSHQVLKHLYDSVHGQMYNPTNGPWDCIFNDSLLSVSVMLFYIYLTTPYTCHLMESCDIQYTVRTMTRQHQPRKFLLENYPSTKNLFVITTAARNHWMHGRFRQTMLSTHNM